MNVDQLRRETPGCAVVCHFNHAGSSLPSAATLSAITEHLELEALNGPSETGVAAAPAVQQVRRDAARLIGAHEGEVALVGSGSQGWGLVFSSLPPLRPGDRILVGRHEWGGNLSTLTRAVRAAGASLEVIPCAEDGTVSPDALAAMVDQRVRLVALTWCPATNGLVNPAAAIGAITRAAGIPYFIDAGQALGQLPVDVDELQCDMLKGAGRKALRGPRGTALLYVRRSFLARLEPPYVDVLSAPWTLEGPTLREDARRFESSENAFALQLGLGEAIGQALSLGLPAIRSRTVTTAEAVRTGLGCLRGVTLHDGGGERSSIVSFTVAGRTASELKAALAAERINVGAIGAPYAPYDMAALGLAEVVRASVSYLTTDEEVGRLVAAVEAAGRG